MIRLDEKLNSLIKDFNAKNIILKDFSDELSSFLQSMKPFFERDFRPRIDKSNCKEALKVISQLFEKYEQESLSLQHFYLDFKKAETTPNDSFLYVPIEDLCNTFPVYTVKRFQNFLVEIMPFKTVHLSWVINSPFFFKEESVKQEYEKLFDETSSLGFRILNEIANQMHDDFKGAYLCPAQAPTDFTLRKKGEWFYFDFFKGFEKSDLKIFEHGISRPHLVSMNLAEPNLKGFENCFDIVYFNKDWPSTESYESPTHAVNSTYLVADELLKPKGSIITWSDEFNKMPEIIKSNYIPLFECKQLGDFNFCQSIYQKIN